MKGTLGGALRSTLVPVVGLTLAGMLTVGCGDKTKNPDAVTVDELKYPGGLTIADKGDGKATLKWFASNNEDGFEGYNVYGMISSAGDGSDLGLTEGQALQLLDDKGDPVDAAKAALTKMDYDPSDGKKLQVAGTGGAPAPADPKDKPDFSFRPIHTLSTADKTKLLLPTCKVTNGVCSLTTDANAGKTVKDDVSYASNGAVTFDVSTADTLKVGSTYCFIVLSTMKAGEQVSQTSSNAACITPKFNKSFNLTTPGGSVANQVINFTDWLADCSTNGSCKDPTDSASQFVKDDAGTHKPDATGNVYLENNGTLVNFVAGANNGVIDLGYYADGFSADSLQATAPAIKLDSNGFLNGGGYSLAGQSMPIQPRHMYVVAVQDATTATKYHYNWVYINADAVTPGTATAVEIRMPKSAK